MEEVLELKEELLNNYSSHFKKLAIGSLKTTNVQREHLIACHIYLRVLDYYNDAVERGFDDLIGITESDYEMTMYKVVKCLQMSKVPYYD